MSKNVALSGGRVSLKLKLSERCLDRVRSLWVSHKGPVKITNYDASNEYVEFQCMICEIIGALPTKEFLKTFTCIREALSDINMIGE